MNSQIDQIKAAIEPLRQQIIHHPVYGIINDLDDLNIFMQHHVFAVWDFMSLLKTLQNNLTCTSIPWVPKGSADTRYLINEIVTGEESDVDQHGKRTSHYELYLTAMQQSGADITPISTFVDTFVQTGDRAHAFATGSIPDSVRSFVDYTFSTIESGKAHVQSAVFTFGREDLIPGMFLSIVNDLTRRFPESISIFQYYLERHIEVDGDHHSHLALEMTANLCGNDTQRWQEAQQATLDALQRRIDLWDGVHAEIMARHAAFTPAHHEEVSPL